MKKPKLLLFGIDGAMPSYVRKFVDKGLLPGFKRLLENSVFFDDCMPVFPSISPTCWASIYTGAVPSVHGGVCQTIHKPGTNPWEYVTPYHSSHIKAERFWETAAKKGYKSLLLSGCSAGPAKTDNVTQIYGGVSISPDRDAADTYVSGRPQQYFYINTGSDQAELIISGAKVAGAHFNTDKVDLPKGREIEPNVYEFEALKGNKNYNADEVEDYSWIIITTKDGVKVGPDIESAKASKTIGVGEWTEPITRILMTDEGPWPFHFRARLDEMDAKEGKYTVYIPACKNLKKEVQQEAVAEEIKDIAEVHGVYIGMDDFKNFKTDKYFEGHKFCANWRRAVIERLMGKEDYDIVFDYIGYVDSINHSFQSFTEGMDENPELLVEEGDPRIKKAEEIYVRCYKAVDEELSWLLDNLVGEDTQICLMSDHGAVGNKDAYHQFIIMEKAGLTTYTTDEYWDKSWRNENIDWSKTKAYCVGSCHAFVNLEGREPCGIVKKEDYHKVVGEIIDAFHKYGRDYTGYPGTAFAVPGDQAGFVGLGGPDCGDVVYGHLGGRMGGYYGRVHSQEIPSAKNDTGGDIRSLCIMGGSKFKKGITLSRPLDITDIAPTMCYAAGFPQPKDATGGIIFQALKDEE